MKRLWLSTIPVVLLSACGGDATPAAQTAVSATAPAVATDAGAAPEAASVHLDKNTPETTTAGTTFVAPAGWTLRARGSAQILDTPEHDVQIAIVETGAVTADAAVKAAWPTLEPKFRSPIKRTDIDDARGWDAGLRYEYQVASSDRRVFRALAMKHGEAWTVVLIDGTEQAATKHWAQIGHTARSVHPAGYVPESFAGKSPNTLDPVRIKRITDLLDRAREDAGVPGFALALVQNGQVIFSGGFGVRELGKPAQVDDDSLFLLSTNTRPLTTLLLAKEVDEGKFTWSTPATDVWPDFKLGDDAATHAVTMRQLGCACIGMPRQDYHGVFEFEKATPESEMTLLGTLQPKTKFGDSFQYSALLASAGGYVGARAVVPGKELGAAYDQAMKTEVLAPLGMGETTFDLKKALGGNHASPHAMTVDGNVTLARENVGAAVVALRPAAGAWSSAEDLTKYVQMELANGKLPDGSQMVSPANLAERLKPTFTMSETETYGMGLSVDSDYGIRNVLSTGTSIGYKNEIFWLPDQQVGGVLLTNGDGGQFFLKPFVRKVLEELFDAKPEAATKMAATIQKYKERNGKWREHILLPASLDVTSKLATHYENAWLGDVTVTHSKGKDGDETTFDFGEWKSRMASRKNDDGTSSLVTTEPGLAYYAFVVGSKDGKRTLSLGDDQPYLFVEK